MDAGGGNDLVRAGAGADTLVTIDGNPAQTIRLIGIGNANTVDGLRPAPDGPTTTPMIPVTGSVRTGKTD